jgi:hypothetical protein
MSVFEAALGAFKEQCQHDLQSYKQVSRFELWIRCLNDFDPDWVGEWPETVHDLHATGALHLVFAPMLVGIQRRDLVNHSGHRVGNYAIYMLQSALNRQGGVRGTGFCVYRINTIEPLFRESGVVAVNPFWYDFK